LVAMAVGPTFNYGVPKVWVGIEKNDLPVFESQAAYLKRHGFLFTGEGRRADFEPVIVSTGNLL